MNRSLLASSTRLLGICALLFGFQSADSLLAQPTASPVERKLIPAIPAGPDSTITPKEMQSVYDKISTPHKYGVIMRPQQGQMLDCPNVFRYDGAWYMIYVSIQDKIGYETLLARSENLVDWEPLGTILPFQDDGWDRWQADGSVALMDPSWGGSYELQQYEGKYWLSYFGGAKQGYETDPLSLGLAWTLEPSVAKPWNRLPENPVLSPMQEDVRPFEAATHYKSHILWDKDEALGYPFVMYYNGKQKGPGIERIGMAVSHDLRHWSRYGDGPVIDNGKGISGDPQVIRLGDLWVMVFFGHAWGPGTFDTFAVSRDLVHWTQWDGEVLILPSEPWDKTFAHKPWLIKHDGVVYHFYCAVGEGGRTIALATSKDLKRGGE